MISRRFLVAALLCVFVLPGLALAEAKPAEPAKKADPAKETAPAKKEEAKPAAPAKDDITLVTGTAVDVTKTAIKVKDKAGKEFEFAISSKTAVKMGTESKKIEDIKKGDQVEVGAKGKNAEAIVLLPPAVVPLAKVSGSVEDVDLKAKTVKIKDVAGKSAAYKLSDKTAIKMGTESKKAEDIKKGDKVEAEARGDALESLALPVVPAAMVSGTAVEVSKKSLTLKDKEGKEREFALTDKTALKKGAETIKAADIKKGDLVEVSARGKDAESVSLLPPAVVPLAKVSGSVEDVDLKAKTVKIKDVAGKSAAYKLSDKTAIKMGTESKKAEDIKKGDKVEAEARGDALESLALPVPPEVLLKVAGTVEDVEIKSKSIKIKDDSGLSRSFEVPDKAEIKSGKIIKKLSDIRKADRVEVQAAGKVARTVTFESITAIVSREVQAALAEIESARKAGAETLASELFEDAVGSLKQAQEEVKKEKFEWALKDAKLSRDKAGQAMQMTSGVLDALKK